VKSLTGGSGMTGMRGRIGEVSGGVDDGLESGTSIKGKDEGVM